MNDAIQRISLTAEQFGDKVLDYEDLNTDVIVRFANGDEYIATFFSFKNLEAMIGAHKQSEAAVSDQYYKILNAVIVNDFNHGDLRPVIEHMMVEGDFQLIFQRV